MPFIRTIEREEATGPLQELYEDVIRERGRLPWPYKAASLHPAAVEAIRNLNQTISFGGSTLGRRKEELIATVVSRVNDCDY